MGLLLVKLWVHESKLLSNTTHLFPCHPASLGAGIPSCGQFWHVVCGNSICTIPCLWSQARSVDLVVVQPGLNHGIVGVIRLHSSPTPP